MSAIFLLAILGAAIYLRIRSVAAEKRRRQDMRVLQAMLLQLAQDSAEKLLFSIDNVYEPLEAKPKRSHKKKQQ